MNLKRLLFLFLSIFIYLFLFQTYCYAELVPPKDPESYKEWKKNLTPEGVTTDPYNDRISVNVGSNSLFTAGTTYGDPTNSNDDFKNLLYGHGEAPWSSYTTFKINGEILRFPFGEVVEAPHEIDNNTNVATYKYKDLIITQTITLVKGPSTGEKDNFRISYAVTNTLPDKEFNDGVSYDVGIRVMLDTMLGNNDDAPFRIPGIGPITTERDFFGNDVPNFWQVYDNLNKPNITGQGTFIDYNGNKPDSVVFANWSRLYNNSWGYAAMTNSSIGDSAVAMYWNPDRIKPGQTKFFETYYGLSGFDGVLGNLSLLLSGDNNLQVNSSGQYNPNPFIAQAYVINDDILARDVKISIELPTGVSLVNPNIKDIYIGDLLPGQEKQITWQLTATPTGEDRYLNYKVNISAANKSSKTVERAIYLPKFSKKVVILLPGVMGSELYRGPSHIGNDHTSEDQVWLPEIPYFQDLDYLEFESNGFPSPNRPAHATRLLPEYFSDSIQQLRDNGFIVETFPYDWRFSNWYDTKFKLKEFIDNILIKHNVEKVDIVAHSMGGIVTKSYLKDYIGDNKIDKVIFVGTPHFGAPDSLYMLRTGDVVGHLNEAFQDIAENIPSLYELMPSKKYFDYYNFYYDEDYDTNSDDISSGILTSWSSMQDYLLQKAFAEGDFNYRLLNRMQDVHDNVDDSSYMNGKVDYYVIAGQNMGTIGSIRDYKVPRPFYLPDAKKTDVSFVRGDGTVPIFSGNWGGSTNHTYYTTVKHANMFTHQGIIQQIINILNDEPNQLGAGITREINDFTGFSVTINSPVTLGIETNHGYVGPDQEGKLIMEDENVTYLKIDHNKFSFIPGDDSFKIKLKGEDKGTFSVTINKIINDKIVESARFVDIPVDTNDTITSVVNTQLNQVELKIDKNNDGIIDNKIFPKVLNSLEANDYTKPQLVADVEGLLGNNGWYRSDVTLRLFATDEGSGVDSVLYSLNESPLAFIYSLPFEINNEGKTKLWSTAKDKNENYADEIMKDINIDKSDPIVSLNLRDEYQINSDLIVDFKAIDSISGIDTVKATLNGKPIQQDENIKLDKLGSNVIEIIASDKAGNTVRYTKKFEVFLPIKLAVEPKEINLNSKGVITVFVYLPLQYQNIPLFNTVSLNGIKPIGGNTNNPQKIIYKFNKESLVDILSKGDDISLNYIGYTGTYYVKGYDTVIVK